MVGPAAVLLVFHQASRAVRAARGCALHMSHSAAPALLARPATGLHLRPAVPCSCACTGRHGSLHHISQLSQCGWQVVSSPSRSVHQKLPTAGRRYGSAEVEVHACTLRLALPADSMLRAAATKHWRLAPGASDYTLRLVGRCGVVALAIGVLRLASSSALASCHRVAPVRYLRYCSRTLLTRT
jgi:hypothetical protein